MKFRNIKLFSFFPRSKDFDSKTCPDNDFYSEIKTWSHYRSSQYNSYFMFRKDFLDKRDYVRCYDIINNGHIYIYK